MPGSRCRSYLYIQIRLHTHGTSNNWNGSIHVPFGPHGNPVSRQDYEHWASLALPASRPISSELDFRRTNDVVRMPPKASAFWRAQAGKAESRTVPKEIERLSQTGAKSNPVNWNALRCTLDQFGSPDPKQPLKCSQEYRRRHMEGARKHLMIDCPPAPRP